MAKAIFYSFFSLLAGAMACILVLVPILSFLNYQFGWELGLWVGPSGSKDFLEVPNNLSDFLMYELLFGITFLFSFGIKKIFDFWPWILEHRRESAVVAIVLALVLVVLGRFVLVQTKGGAFFAAIEEKSTVDLLDAIKKEPVNNETSYLAFETAAKFDNLEAIKILAENGYDINARREEDSLTPLMAASSWYSSASVDALVKNGADVNLRDVPGGTALIYALYSGYTRTEADLLPIVKILCEAGADVTVKDAMGVAPLELAKDNSWMQIVDVLEKKL